MHLIFLTKSTKYVKPTKKKKIWIIFLHNIIMKDFFSISLVFSFRPLVLKSYSLSLLWIKIKSQQLAYVGFFFSKKKYERYINYLIFRYYNFFVNVFIIILNLNFFLINYIFHVCIYEPPYRKFYFARYFSSFLFYKIYRREEKKICYIILCACWFVML